MIPSWCTAGRTYFSSNLVTARSSQIYFEDLQVFLEKIPCQIISSGVRHRGIYMVNPEPNINQQPLQLSSIFALVKCTPEAVQTPILDATPRPKVVSLLCSRLERGVRSFCRNACNPSAKEKPLRKLSYSAYKPGVIFHIPSRIRRVQTLTSTGAT